MGIRGLQFATLNIPLGAGLSQREDDRTRNAPALDRCVDAQFDEVGGLQLRYPFASIGNSIYGGGTISNARKLAVNGDELLCFTSDSLYSWSPQLAAWVLKGTHLAAKVTATDRFVSTGDQVECDRAELNGTVVYAWRDNTSVYAAAIDKTSGTVLAAPTKISGTDNASKPRLVALSTKILLFLTNATTINIEAIAIDPASPSTAIGGARTTIVAQNGYYDVVKIVGQDVAALVVTLNPTTSYQVMRISAALAAASTSNKARTSTGPIAISSDPSGTYLQVARVNATIKGDLLSATTLADVFTNQAIGTGTVTHLTCAHRSVQNGGAYRAYVFWSDDGTSYVGGSTVKSNWVDTANTLGTEAVFRVGALELASRAFDYNGSVFVHLVFAGTTSGAGYTAAALQNTYYLYRDDHALISKALPGTAGGFSSSGHLPGVALTSGSTYAWCGTVRRVVPLDAYDGYADRGPCDVAVSFDSNEARRCVRLGKTLYITGGEILQYDGSQLTEVGFDYYPYNFTAGTQPGAALAALGGYTYKPTYRWTNAQGETERSTTAAYASITVGASTRDGGVSNLKCLNVTRKTSPQPAIELWRTAVNPTSSAPYYLVTSADPTVGGAVANGYIANDDTQSEVYNTLPSFDDAFTDAVLTTKETNPETSGVLEYLAPPPATIIAASETRIFLAGIPGDPDRVWYSRLRNEGEIAAFHDALTFTVPPAGGAITGLAFLNETLLVFRQFAIYAFPGDGYANDGTGINYGPARVLSTDIGAVSAEGLAVIEQGIVLKSSKGYYLLNKGWALDYIGAPVVDYDSEAPLAIHVLTNRHHVRILTSARMLVWDYLANQWGEWTIASGLDAAIWNGAHHYLTSTAVKAEQTSYSGVDYGLDIETAWIKLDQLQGFGRIRRLLALGEYRSAHALRIRLARDYWKDGANTYFQDTAWTVTPATVGAPEQVRIGPAIQQMEALKIRITPCLSAVSTSSPPTGEAVKLSGLALELGLKEGPYQMLPSGQKT